MPTARSNPLKDAPGRWFLKAVAIGFFTTFPLALLLSGFRFGVALRSGAIGVVFCLVMWSGFEFLGPWVQGGSGRSVGMAQVRWLLLYTTLYGVCLLLLRLFFGFNLLRSPVMAVLSYLLGYAISSTIVGLHAASNLAETGRELEQARGEAKLMALKAQLSPHTLFNALNTIAALIPGDPAGAEAAVENLSRFLRRILEALERERWSLGEEFDLIAFLLELEQARFGDRLRFHLELPATEAGRLIPPLLLLPLVENSLKHGFRPKVGPCMLSVTAEAGVIRVVDDGVGMAAGAGLGVGLGAVRSRLELVGGTLVWPPAAAGCIAEVRLCR